MPPEITNSFSEDELVSEIRKGNKNAFQSLFYLYYNRLIEFSFYRLKNLDAAKDLVQEVFTNIWISRSNLDPNKSIKSYLYKSLTNRIINYAAHSSSQTLKIDVAQHKNLSSSKSSLDDKIDLSTAINELPANLKTVFMLSRIERFTYAEIAEICDISIKAVEKRMSKALKILRKIFN
jgi:RNA polymerase sigma-70 factor (ECF subfamily)